MRRDCRTKNQNNILVEHTLDGLIQGESIKTMAVKFNIPLESLRCILKRHKKRHGFKSIYQMVAIYTLVKERKSPSI